MKQLSAADGLYHCNQHVIKPVFCPAFKIYSNYFLNIEEDTQHIWLFNIYLMVTSLGEITAESRQGRVVLTGKSESIWGPFL